MVSNDKYNSNLAFIDLLFNVLVGFVFLFVVAFVLINPIAKKADIVSPAQFLITMAWPDEDINDFDLWVRDPVGNYIGFNSKDRGITNLDRDDLGAANDAVNRGGLPEVKVNLNREVTSVRGILPGEYIVSVHLYKIYDNEVVHTGVPITVEIQKINPYNIVFKETRVMSQLGEVVNFVRFVVDENGYVSEITATMESAVPASSLPANSVTTGVRPL